MLKLEKELDKAANAALPYVENADSAYYERYIKNFTGCEG